VRSIEYDKLPKGEWIITGGFPCQDISVAGNKAGLEGERSGIFSEYVRLIGEIRPAFAIMENVGNLASWFDTGEGRYPPTEALVEDGERSMEVEQYQGIAKCIGSLSEIGYDSEWAIIRASDVGAPHRRERIWFVGYPCGGGCGRSARQRTGAESSHGYLQLETRTFPDTQGEQREWSGNSRRWRAGFTDDSEALGEKIPNPHILDDDTSGHGTGRICRERSPKAEVSRSDPDTDSQRCQELIDRITVRAGDIDSPSCRNGIGNFWAVEPNVGRVANGVSSRVDRLKCLGNSVVPQIPELIFMCPAFDRWRRKE
jgi:DNA (cytosine-5)-methyltransferase 1